MFSFPDEISTAAEEACRNRDDAVQARCALRALQFLVLLFKNPVSPRLPATLPPSPAR
jgi:hypothetical protein